MRNERWGMVKWPDGSELEVGSCPASGRDPAAGVEKLSVERQKWVAPPVGLEPTPQAPEARALSPELRGHGTMIADALLIVNASEQ